jgi:hypothetical protein
VDYMGCVQYWEDRQTRESTTQGENLESVRMHDVLG